jgi:hypothetical protein
MWIKGDLSEKETGTETKRWANGQPREAEERTYMDISRQVKGRKNEVDKGGKILLRLLSRSEADIHM